MHWSTFYRLLPSSRQATELGWLTPRQSTAFSKRALLSHSHSLSFLLDDVTKYCVLVNTQKRIRANCTIQYFGHCWFWAVLQHHCGSQESPHTSRCFCTQKMWQLTSSGVWVSHSSSAKLCAWQMPWERVVGGKIWWAIGRSNRRNATCIDNICAAISHKILFLPNK